MRAIAAQPASPAATGALRQRRALQATIGRGCSSAQQEAPTRSVTIQWVVLGQGMRLEQSGRAACGINPRSCPQHTRGDYRATCTFTETAPEFKTRVWADHSSPAAATMGAYLVLQVPANLLQQEGGLLPAAGRAPAPRRPTPPTDTKPRLSAGVPCLPPMLLHNT